MKDLRLYINEKLVLTKDTFKKNYKYFPKTAEELRKILEQLIEERGKDAYLNDIDVSNMDSMGNMIKRAGDKALFEGLDPHNIDISEWDVSNVENMDFMFYDCENFNCDLSKWDVSKVKSMMYMFNKCKKFKGIGLENWDVSNVYNMDHTFFECENFNCDLSKWDVSNIIIMNGMFEDCINFKGDGLENWNIKSATELSYMFYNCSSLNCDLSNWDVSNISKKQFMFQKSSLKAKYKPKK